MPLALRYSYPVVCHREVVVVPRVPVSHLDSGRLGLVELYRVAHQVAQELLHPHLLRHHDGHLLYSDDGVARVHLAAQILQHLLHQPTHVHLGVAGVLPAHPAQRQQPVDEPHHPLGGRQYTGQVVLAGGVQPVPVVLQEEAAEALDGHERRLQVVAHDVGEVVQLLVGLLQLPQAPLERRLRVLPPRDVVDGAHHLPNLAVLHYGAPRVAHPTLLAAAPHTVLRDDAPLAPERLGVERLKLVHVLVVDQVTPHAVTELPGRAAKHPAAAGADVRDAALRPGEDDDVLDVLHDAPELLL